MSKASSIIEKAESATAEVPRNITIGDCKECGEGHVLRAGVCWDCEHKAERGQS